MVGFMYYINEDLRSFPAMCSHVCVAYLTYFCKIRKYFTNYPPLNVNIS